MEKVENLITTQAKEAVAEIVKIYVVAINLEADAKAVLASYVQADIDAGKYDADLEEFNYEYNNEKSAKWNERQMKKAEKELKKANEKALKEAEENKKELLENAADFIVNDKVFREWKKELGRANWRVYEEQYGEQNVRAAIQFNQLMYYLTSTNIEMHVEEGEDHSHSMPLYKTAADGTVVLDFRTITYTIAD